MRHRVSQAISRISGRPRTDQRPNGGDDFHSTGDVSDATQFAGVIAIAMAAFWQLTVS